MLHPDEKNPIRIGISEDHLLVRQTFKNFLSQQAGFRVVLDVDDGGKLIKELKNSPAAIDVLLLDLFSPRTDGDARQTLKTLGELYPSISVIVLSVCDNQGIIDDIFSLGAYGFISKNSEPAELLEAIRAAANKEIYQNRFYQFNEHLKLRPDEVRILELIWQEKTSEEIAANMYMSLSAIEKLRHRLKEKTDTKTTVGLIKYALERRLIVPGQPKC